MGLSVRGVFLLAGGGLFLLAEFFLCVSTPACGDFLLAEVFWFVNFSCSRNFSCLWASLACGVHLAQVFCLGSFPDCVVPPIFWLFTLSTAYCNVSYLFTQIFAAFNFARVWRPSHDKIIDNSTVEEKWPPFP